MQLTSDHRRLLLPVQADQSARAGSTRCCSPRYVVWLVACWCAAILFGSTMSAYGQVIDREYKLKAVYLYKFGTYVEWPRGTFRDSNSPFVIGILGPDPVGVHLRKIARVKRINGRKIEVRNYQSMDEIRDCHILYMSRGLKAETQQAALAKLVGRNILSVGETQDFLKQGGNIDFVIQENRVRIYISKPAYERDKLDVSAQLLRIAIVKKSIP